MSRSRSQSTSTDWTERQEPKGRRRSKLPPFGPAYVPEAINKAGQAFHSPAFGIFDVSAQVVHIVNTPQYQRLHAVREMPLSSLIYPSQMRNKFETALGAVNIMQGFIEQLTTSGRLKGLIRPLHLRAAVLSGLIESIGDYPLSIQVSRIMNVPNFQLSHRAADIIRTEPLTSLIEEHWDLDPVSIAGAICDDHELAHQPGWKFVSDMLRGPLSPVALSHIVANAREMGMGGVIDVGSLIKCLEVGRDGTLNITPTATRTFEAIVMYFHWVIDRIFFARPMFAVDRMLVTALSSLVSVGADITACVEAGSELGALSSLLEMSAHFEDKTSHALLSSVQNRQVHSVVASLDAQDIQTPVGFSAHSVKSEDLEERASRLLGRTIPRAGVLIAFPQDASDYLSSLRRSLGLGDGFDVSVSGVKVYQELLARQVERVRLIAHRDIAPDLYALPSGTIRTLIESLL